MTHAGYKTTGRTPSAPTTPLLADGTARPVHLPAPEESIRDAIQKTDGGGEDVGEDYDEAGG